MSEEEWTEASKTHLLNDVQGSATQSSLNTTGMVDEIKLKYDKSKMDSKSRKEQLETITGI